MPTVHIPFPGKQTLVLRYSVSSRAKILLLDARSSKFLLHLNYSPGDKQVLHFSIMELRPMDLS